MKKRLFFQGIFILFISLVISALVLVCTTGAFLAIRDIPVKGNRLTSDSAVIYGGKVTYSSAELSPTEQQNLLLSIEAGEDEFSRGKASYTVTQHEFSDGTKLVQLTPKMDILRVNKILTAYAAAVFFSVYLIVLAVVQKKNENEIAAPLTELKNQTHRLACGELDINIPDAGSDEINRLAKEIESLRIRLKEEVYMNKKASENRKFLISSVSHDLRTPITALKGYLEGILDGVADTEEKRGIYVKKSLEKTELINTMISDLLLYSKLDLNQVEFKLLDIDIAAYLAAFAEDMRPVFARENKKISFVSKVKDMYNVRVDVQQMDRVMGNIVTNALKYISSSSGEVQLILRENASSVIIEVMDNGIGIDDEDISKIFDRFYRCEKSRQINGSSGLGLAISKQIIENMDGRIWAVSKSGEGTSILISLKKVKGKEVLYEKNSDN
ncbi:MAG: HAMP domain-containing sensor histidine kinase [Firmicutes bacterium]|nr:HAMP domain-containing sensor histidine kinase [Bacillota bacterium]